MFLTLERVFDYERHGSFVNVLLREVETEKEAFTEMRRFLEVNNIYSDVTCVRCIATHQSAGSSIPKHKEVIMSQCGHINGRKPWELSSVAFSIYPSTSYYSRDDLGTTEDWDIMEKLDYYDGISRLMYREKISGRNRYAEWYNCAKRYFEDLELRKKVGD